MSIKLLKYSIIKFDENNVLDLIFIKKSVKDFLLDKLIFCKPNSKKSFNVIKV
jgi:hypothetical protein